MKKINYNIFLFFIFTTIYQGCKNKDCHKSGECPPEYYRIRLGESKKYLFSLPGSYWIYKNTNTGELDTQKCLSFVYDSIVRKGTQDYSKHITAEYDYIRRTIQSSYTNFLFSDKTLIGDPDFNGYNSNNIILQRSLLNDIGYIKPFFNPFTNGLIAGTGSSNTISLGLDSNLSIQGKTYYNVAKFDIDQDDIWYNYANYPNTVYYWAKDVGLVKRLNKTDNYSWELIEYNIIK